MVDFARIQNRIYYGYTKAAQRLGTAHNIYRSTDGINPLKQANFLKSTLISIDQNLTYIKTSKYNDPLWQFLPQDGLTLQNFDYMVGGTTTYFIIDIAPDDRLSPPICIECNATISIARTINSLVPGTNPYQQYQRTTPTIADQLPCSLLQHSRVEANNLKLPTSVKLPYYSIIVPNIFSTPILAGDIVTDDLGRRLAVISAELTRRTLGLRIIASEEGT